MRLACTHNNCEGQWCANLHHLPVLISGVGGYLEVGGIIGIRVGKARKAAA